MEKTYTKNYSNDEEELSFTFRGNLAKKSISSEKIETLLDRCFKERERFGEVSKVVSWIRTVLKDVDESFLNLVLSKDMKETRVTYVNQQLLAYHYLETFKEHHKSSKVNYEAQFSANKQVQFSLSDNQGEIVEYPFYKNSIHLIQDTMKELRELKRAYPVTLNEEGKALCEIYQLFYNELPDFSLEKTREKMQAMMSVLVESNISLGDDYCFSTLNEKGLPISQNLEYLLLNYIPLGKVERQEEPFIISPQAKERVLKASEALKETSDNPDIMVPKMSRIIYESHYDLLGKNMSFFLAHKSSCSVEEVEKSIQYVKRITEAERK